MKMCKKTCWVFLVAMFGLSGWAQQTGTIAGKVTGDTGEGMPGVVVSLEAPELQGSRTAVSMENGDFLFRLLPPGDYTITATMAGMKTAKTALRLGLGQTARPKLVLSPEIAEELVVTAEAESILDSSEVASNMESETLEQLPAGRTITGAATLAPGVSDGVNGLQISGAQSFENMYLVNGVMVNEQVRGQPHSAYIEDAVQEVSVLSGAISAEYGHFSGGVINTITKSGGNKYEGSLRVSFDNEKWQARNPDWMPNQDERNDKTNHIESATIGGPIIKDRLWFFVAGRRQRDESQITIPAGIPMTDRIARRLGYDTGQWAPPEHRWPHGVDNDRLEVKLTGTIFENHTVIASYLDAESVETNDDQFGVLNESALIPQRKLPNTLLSFNYRGVISPEMTLEALYSKKEFTFKDAGGTDQNPVTGSVIHPGGQAAENIGAPFFSSLSDEERDNETMYLKGSYFLTTSNWGSHDISAGISELTEIRKADNHQAASDWRVYSSYTRWDTPADPNNPFADDPFPDAYPIFTADFNSVLYYWPIIRSSQGSDFAVQSAYINDSWTLNEKWHFNLGFRFDKNEVKAQDGTLLSDDSQLSPRLAGSYDLYGDGRYKFGASFGKYVSRIAEAAGGVSSAGDPAVLGWYYFGETTESLAEVFQWFYDWYGVPAWDASNPEAFQEGLLNNADAVAGAYYVRFPGVTKVLQEPLDSPFVDEYTITYSMRLGNRGFFKADYIHREYDKFYIDRVDTTTGTVEVAAGELTELIVMDNSDGEYERNYDGVQMQYSYRLTDKFELGGNYTWSQLRGNIVGETSGSGSVTVGTTTTYPEFNDYPRRNPVGYLPGDVRHRVNLWASYDFNTRFGDINLSMIQKYQSGEPYSHAASWSIDRNAGADYSDFGLPSPADLGYINPPTSVTYYISDRGEFRTEDYYRTDLAVNYAFTFKRIEFFVQLEVYNLLNQDAYLAAENWTIDTTGMPGFNVYNETPVEGVHYLFEYPDDEEDYRSPGYYQAPRWFQFDVGFKF